MPSSLDQEPFNPALLEPAARDGPDRDRLHAAAGEPPPWPWRVTVPLIAGLSLALWAGIVVIGRALGAG